MATIEQTSAPVRAPVAVTSIQPGGGWCIHLELAWGRWRRAWLRRFRPDHVRRMAEKRQGACPDCPHDIVDARDLKLFRNVCGYSFPDEPDPCRRGTLPLARAGIVELLVFSGLFLLATVLCIALALLHWAFLLPLVLIVPAWVFVISFFRDPERAIPAEGDVLVSPADGTITDIGEVAEPDFPGGKAFRIGIFLSVFNVHVNRIPRSGKIVALHYYPGSFLDARNQECGVKNEQFWIDVEEPNGRRIRVKQIAGAIARRIVCWLRPDETVTRGERLGMIKFGSRTELYLPAGETTEVCVKVGDAVRGASTVLARLK